MMAAQLRGAAAEGEGQGLGQALKNGIKSSLEIEQEKKEPVVLKNRAGESKSPYVRQHASNPVAWQIWGDEAIELARSENKLLFVSIGYSACHWCHVMERESFENEEVAAILNESFIPVKIDREERPDIDRIYMNYVTSTTGHGGWPLNVFLTPELNPVFGGTYWPGPTSTTTYEDQLDFLGILNKLSTAWKEQEQRFREESGEILRQLKDFAAEGTFGNRLGEGGEGLDIELLEEANSHISSTYDSQNGGFGGAPKFPTPGKLAFLLRIGQYPQVVRDVVGEAECENAENMAISTLRKMARGGIHDHIGNGFARYSVTADWSLPHFEKMLFDNAQLLHTYLDGFLLCRDPELLGVVYDIATYLLTTLAHPDGGFYSSEDADSYYRKGDAEKREGAFYVWTKRELVSVLGSEAEPVLSAFLNVQSDGNVLPENDAHDEFIDQNVLAIVSTPNALATKFGLKEEDVVSIIKDGKAKLREHREKERVRPALDDKIVVGWNGIAIGALARSAAVIKGFDPEKSSVYLSAALKAATFIKSNLYDEESKLLYRVWREGRGDTEGFADDYALLIEGLIDLYESTFDEKWLKWADELQKTQISLFYDTTSGAFFCTPSNAAHVILRLKEGMDSSEPSANGVSVTNLYRLSSLLADDDYAQKAKETLHSFESEVLQHPFLYPSFAPAIVAGRLGVRGIVVTFSENVESEKGKEKAEEEPKGVRRIKEFEKSPRGGIGTFIKITPQGNEWLRSRNELLTHFGLDGRGRVLVCADGVCIEEREVGDEVTSIIPETLAPIGQPSEPPIIKEAQPLEPPTIHRFEEEKEIEREPEIDREKTPIPGEWQDDFSDDGSDPWAHTQDGVDEKAIGPIHIKDLEGALPLKPSASYGNIPFDDEPYRSSSPRIKLPPIIRRDVDLEAIANRFKEPDPLEDGVGGGISALRFPSPPPPTYTKREEVSKGSERGEIESESATVGDIPTHQISTLESLAEGEEKEFIHVSDVARGHIAALGSTSGGPLKKDSVAKETSEEDKDAKDVKTEGEGLKATVEDDEGPKRDISEHKSENLSERKDTQLEEDTTDEKGHATLEPSTSTSTKEPQETSSSSQIAKEQHKPTTKEVTKKEKSDETSET